MTLLLRITETAEDDLADIWAFIARHSPINANAFIQKIESKFQPLCDNPKLGPSRNYLAPNLRAHFYRDYVIYYMFNENELVIIRVVHGSREALTINPTNQDNNS